MKNPTPRSSLSARYVDSIRTAERPTEKVYCRHGSVGFPMTRFDVKKQGTNNG